MDHGNIAHGISSLTGNALNSCFARTIALLNGRFLCYLIPRKQSGGKKNYIDLSCNKWKKIGIGFGKAFWHTGWRGPGREKQYFVMY